MAAAPGGNADGNAEGEADRPSQGAARQPEPGPLLREAYAVPPVDEEFARGLLKRLEAELPARSTAAPVKRHLYRMAAPAALAASVLVLACAALWYRGKTTSLASRPPPPARAPGGGGGGATEESRGAADTAGNTAPTPATSQANVPAIAGSETARGPLSAGSPDSIVSNVPPSSRHLEPLTGVTGSEGGGPPRSPQLRPTSVHKPDASPDARPRPAPAPGAAGNSFQFGALELTERHVGRQVAVETEGPAGTGGQGDEPPPGMITVLPGGRIVYRGELEKVSADAVVVRALLPGSNDRYKRVEIPRRQIKSVRLGG